MSFLDDLINKLDQSVDLYGILSGMDQAFGEEIRRQLLYELEYWASPESLEIIINMLKNPAKADWEFIKGLIEREFKGRPTADGTLPPWEKDKGEKEKPVVKKEPPPISGDGTITPKAPPPGYPAPVKAPTTPKPRKLLPPVVNPGFTSTEITHPINARTQIGSKRWGELICYCVQEKAVTMANPPLSASTTNQRASKSLETLLGILYADAMPASLPLKQAVKAKASWWGGSAWVAPSSVQGLTGDVSLVGGSDALFDIAHALSVQSFNAYVGFQAELYVETEEIMNAVSFPGTRSFAPVPVIAGHNTMAYEIGILQDKDMGVFMGVPYDEWVKATPKTGNLQLLFYGKMQPPYSFKGPDGKYSRYRPSTVNIPDPRELTWEEIKSTASAYTGGGHCCTIQLACGRPIVAWADSDSAAEDRARALATLSTSPVTSKDPVVTIIKSKPTVAMYPGTAIYTVRANGASTKRRMKLWVENAEDSGYNDELLVEEDLSSLA